MRRIEYKNLKYNNILIKCVHNIHNTQLQTSIYNNIDNFKTRSSMYNKLGNSSKLYEMPTDILEDGFTYENMIFLYGKLRDSQHARTYYNFILGLSTICPYCNEQLSASLDHYLPKVYYPMYSIDPRNLVPSCTDCNSLKKDKKQTYGNETFHPYYDIVGEERWLYCLVEETGEGLAFNFNVQKPLDLTDLQFNKIEYHFNTLKLNEMYSILASKEIHSRIFSLTKLYELGGYQSIKDEFNDSFGSNYNIEKNSWKTALYDGLRNDEWFCCEGINKFNYVEFTSDLSLLEEEDLEIPQ